MSLIYTRGVKMDSLATMPNQNVKYLVTSCPFYVVFTINFCAIYDYRDYLIIIIVLIFW